MSCFWRAGKWLVGALGGCTLLGLILYTPFLPDRRAVESPGPAGAGAAVEPVSFVLEPHTLDLGRVGVGTTKGFKTTVRNLTDRALPFVGFESGCGCSRLAPEVGELLPGGAVAVTGEFRPPANQPGAFRKEVLVRWGDPASRPGVLTLTGEIIREIVLAPEMVVLRPDAAEGRGGAAAVQVENRSRQPVHFRLESTPEGVTCQPAGLSLAPGDRGTLTFNCDPWFLARESVSLYAATTHPAEQRIPLGLVIAPAHALQARPAAFKWGTLTRQELLKQSPLELRVRGEGLRHFDLRQVEAPPFLALRDRAVSAGEIRLTFDVKGEALSADLNNAVVLHLQPKDRPRAVALKVPTSGILLDP